MQPLTGDAHDYDALLEAIGDARIVLLGEASHGTHEFYAERAKITWRLILERGFHAVAVEADWPDAYRVNAYVRGRGDDRSADDALGGFKRFPTWMWRNRDVLAFVEWLREHNASRPNAAEHAGFYGLDLYSLRSSIGAVLEYLDNVDPEAAARARYRYGCFGDAGEDSQAYGYAAAFNLTQSCEDAAVRQLMELREHAAEYASRDGRLAEDELFYAEQNARLVKNAEEYYRTMFSGRVSSWNLRDRHMADTLDELVAHLDSRVGRSKVVVWEHNSHVGDARATQMGREGEWNVGQLARERHGEEAFVVGFTTYTGTVTAASDWGGTPERKRVRPALPDSWEALFHETGEPRFMLLPSSAASLRGSQRLERAIGVIYRPDSERISHYFYAALPEQFDAVLHFDETSALEPLEREALWDAGEPPETFPTGE